MALFCGCWGMIKSVFGLDDEDDHENDTTFWSTDGKHYSGEYSYAAVRANSPVQDYSQFDFGPPATFFGIYAGHNGREAAQYVSERLFGRIMELCVEDGHVVSKKTMRRAILEMERGFIQSTQENPRLATVGTSCVIGFILRRSVLVANLGDSRAVMCRRRLRYKKPEEEFEVVQLTREHSVREPSIRQSIEQQHPWEPDIIRKRGHTYCIKGMIPVTRSIGDAYLKSTEFGVEDTESPFHFETPLAKAALFSEPEITECPRSWDDLCLVCASHGLWEHLSNEDALRIIVANLHNRKGIARKLAREAMKRCAKRLSIMRRVVNGITRRVCHDDMTVMVVYTDPSKQKLVDYKPLAARTRRPFSAAHDHSKFILWTEIWDEDKDAACTWPSPSSARARMKIK